MTTEIGEIKIDTDHEAFVFRPADDITAKEVALIFQLFLNFILNKEADSVNFDAYVIKHSLGRHFFKIRKE